MPVRFGKICAAQTGFQRLSHASTLFAVVDSQFGGCNGAPLYGTREGPLIFCQTHKRAGLFTVRDGEIFLATRDGSGKVVALLASLR